MNSLQNNLEKFNLIWAAKANHTFTQEELDKGIEENPNFWNSYYLQERVAKKYGTFTK